MTLLELRKILEQAIVCCDLIDSGQYGKLEEAKNKLYSDQLEVEKLFRKWIKVNSVQFYGNGDLRPNTNLRSIKESLKDNIDVLDKNANYLIYYKFAIAFFILFIASFIPIFLQLDPKLSLPLTLTGAFSTLGMLFAASVVGSNKEFSFDFAMNQVVLQYKAICDKVENVLGNSNNDNQKVVGYASPDQQNKTLLNQSSSAEVVNGEPSTRSWSILKEADGSSNSISKITTEASDKFKKTLASHSGNEANFFAKK